MSPDEAPHSLSDILSSGAFSRLVLHFLVHPEPRLHFRALRRHTGLGIHSLQRELRKLETLGLLRRVEEGRKVYFVPEGASARWDSVRAIVRDFAQPEEVLDEALSGLRGQIHVASINPVAEKDSESRADTVELQLAAESITPKEVYAELGEAGSVLGREVNVHVYGAGTLEKEAVAEKELGSPGSRSIRWLIRDGR